MSNLSNRQSDPKSKAKPAQRSNGVSSLLAPGSTTSIPPFLATASLRIALTAFCLGTLAGLVLPRALLVLSASSWRSGVNESTARFLTWKVWQSLNAATDKNVVDQPWQRPQLHFYLLAWSLFHLLEFVITARYNQTRLYSDCE